MSALRSLKGAVIRAGQALPWISNPIWSAVYPYIRRDEFWGGTEYTDDHRETFETIYGENRWLSKESRSGHGSTLMQTTFLRRALPGLIEDLGARTLLDAPCGDFNWMRHVTLSDEVNYIGGDIVRPMIDNLNARFSSPRHRFRILDIITDSLPDADVWLCRDVLFHLPEDDVLRVLENFVRSNIGFLLTTTYTFASENRDVRGGGFRFINLTRPPFDLPTPRMTIDDYVFPEPPRKLGLWARDEIAAALH
jgi:hypothetical protein